MIETRWSVVSLVAAWVVLTTVSTLSAAEVFDGDVRLTTQTQVNEFAYTEVTGEVLVHDDRTDPITNLDALNSLTSVGSLLLYDNDSLTNVDGLNSLTSVEDTLVVFSNDLLTDIDGLSSLTSVGQILDFFANASLTNVDGLSSLTWVGRGLSVFANSSLTDVDGLSNVSYVGSLIIDFNSSLTNVDGLSGLMSVGDSMIIADNDSLTDLHGLSSLTSVGLFLDILRNESLQEFCGLYPLLAAGGPGTGLLIFDNAVNPTGQEILDGGPCDPADTIMDLFDEGAINRGQARALLELADKSLQGLTNILEAFVHIGILTPSEAQLLFVIATNRSMLLP